MTAPRHLSKVEGYGLLLQGTEEEGTSEALHAAQGRPSRHPPVRCTVLPGEIDRMCGALSMDLLGAQNTVQMLRSGGYDGATLSDLALDLEQHGAEIAAGIAAVSTQARRAR